VGEPAPQAAGSSQIFIVYGLDLDTTYYFAIKTADEAPNASNVSNCVSNTTSQEQALIDTRYTWDAGGNLYQRQDALASQTETFTYDFLDRLTGVSGPYTQTFVYDEIGNITSMNGTAYTYGDQPHAATAVGAKSYVYDDNGNMTTRDSQTITWDVENRPVTVSGGASFIYDGDGNRGKKTEGGQTILYVNKYYEKNLTTGEVTTYYYLGGQQVAMRKGTTLTYTHQDHLSGTAMTSNTSGASTSTIKYFPFGSQRSSTGTIPTDKQFTGQRLDTTGLYFYNARYYDPTIGRFISADTIVANPADPQCFNRYSYVLNNPLKYVDPTGLYGEGWDSATDGTSAWSEADGMWLVAFNGQWMPMNPESVQVPPPLTSDPVTTEEPEPSSPLIYVDKSKNEPDYLYGLQVMGRTGRGAVEIIGGVITIDLLPENSHTMT
jgi:RHS repeat-associated protein